MVNYSKGEKIFNIINLIILSIFALITLLPFMHVVAKSMSEEGAVVSGTVKLIPIGFQLETYKYVLFETSFFNSFKVSSLVTVIGTISAILITAMTAYPLSNMRLKGRKLLIYFFIFTMIFNGGLVPNYLLFRYLGLINTIWAMIFPLFLNIFYVLIVKSFYENIPVSLQEAARIDGASNLLIFFKIILPIAKPILATLTVFYSVRYWNDYFHALIYITDPKLKPLQLHLLEIFRQSEDPLSSGVDALINLSPEIVRATTVVVSTVPILLVYPFMQKHFVKGITIGSVKG